jgi:Cu-processing system permease protein
MRQVGRLLRFEIAAARKSRVVVIFGLGFAVATMAMAVTGLSSGGVIAVQGFARTSMSLMQLVLWVVPLLGLLIGASVGAESLELEFQVSLPVSRQEILLARWCAWLLVTGGALTAGLSVAGIPISLGAGPGDAWRYFRLLGVANLLQAASLALGLMLGVFARSRIRAMGFAVAVWVILVIGVDLIAIGGLAILPKGQAGWPLTLLLMLDPVDSARALSISLLQADIVSGPTGAALRKVLGGYGVWALFGSLLLWTWAAIAAAARRFRRQDL